MLNLIYAYIKPKTSIHCMKQTSLLVKTISQITFGLTVLLILLGTIGYNSTKSDLENAEAADAQRVIDRLAASLPITIWNFDSNIAGKTILAEINANFINSISVISNDKIFVSLSKSLDGTVTANTDSPRKNAFTLKKNLEFIEDGTTNPVGELIITYNQDRTEAALSNALNLEILRIVLLDIAAAILVTLIIRSSVIRPIIDVRNAIQDIAQGNGDLTKRLSEKGVRELAELSRSFNDFVERLDDLVKNVNLTTLQLAEKAKESQIYVEDMRGELSRQKSEIDLVASASTELSSSTEIVASNALQAADSAKIANTSAQKTHTIVNDSITSIRSLSNEINQISDIIKTLVKEGENIGTVSGVIQGIAEQTNLLALNAAIEAARAGEQGRGFAVVADEVRTLAQRTQQSTEEINKMIERLQKSTEVADQAVRKGNANAESSVEKIEQAGNSINDVARNVDEINEMNSQIAQAASEQSSVINELNKNIVNISHNADSTSSLADKTSSTSSSSMEIALELKEKMNSFKTS
jgi:methyl-accepting chemotaxis protein